MIYTHLKCSNKFKLQCYAMLRIAGQCWGCHLKLSCFCWKVHTHGGTRRAGSNCGWAVRVHRRKARAV